MTSLYMWVFPLVMLRPPHLAPLPIQCLHSGLPSSFLLTSAFLALDIFLSAQKHHYLHTGHLATVV